MFCHEPFKMFCGLQNFPQLLLWVNLSIKGTNDYSSYQSNPQAGAVDNSLGIVPCLKAAHCSFASGCEK